MSTPLPPDWTDVLDRIQASLRKAIAEVDASQASQAKIEPPLTDYGDVLKLTLATRLESLTGKLQALQNAGRDVDALMAGGEESLRAHVDAIGAVRSRLEAWAARAIG